MKALDLTYLPLTYLSEMELAPFSLGGRGCQGVIGP